MSTSTYGATDRRTKEKTLNPKVHNFKERDYSASEWSNIEQKILGNYAGTENTTTSKGKQEPLFAKIPRKIFPNPCGLQQDKRESHCNVSLQAIGLYCYLKYLWDCLGKPTEFYRTDEQISDDLGVSDRTTRKLKKELSQAGVIEYWRASVKKGNKQTVTYYKFLQGY